MNNIRTKNTTPRKIWDFTVSDDSREIFLTSLLGLTCGSNGYNPEIPPEASWPGVVCYDNKRSEKNLFHLEDHDLQSNDASFSLLTNDNVIKFDIKYSYDPASGIISCNHRLENTSDKVISIRRALPRFCFSSGKYKVYSQLSRWGGENIGSWHDLDGINIELKSAPGRLTTGNSPYCVLKDMDTGKALAFHVIPRGNWKIKIFSQFHTNEAPNAVIELGLSDNDLQYKLDPGKVLKLPEILIQDVPDGDITKAAPLLHRYCLSEKFPKYNLILPPVLYNTWLYRFSDFTLEQLRKQLDAAARIGCEVFVVDAGWAGENDLDWGVGNWKEKSERAFYGNMKDFADEVRAKGLGLGIWMEPERFPKDMPLRKNHPEWFPENSERIDLTIPAAADYFYDSIAKLVEKYSLKFMKTDMNAPLGYDGSGHELYTHCAIWRGIMEKLKADYPGFIIENCAGGALRTDLNTTQFFDTQFVSDNANPLEALRIYQGSVLRLPPGRLQRWSVMRPAPECLTPLDLDQKYVLVPWSATWLELEQTNLDYVMTSAFAGIPGFSGDLGGLPPEYLDRAAEYVQFYKEHRSELVDAVAHLLTPAEELQLESDWITIQLQHENTDKNIVLSYNNPSVRKSTRLMTLRNLDPTKEYFVRQVFPERSDEIVVSGEELMTNGLEINLQAHMHVRFGSGIWLIELK